MLMQVSLTVEKQVQFFKRPQFLYCSVSFGLPAEIIKWTDTKEVNSFANYTFSRQGSESF